MEKSQTMCESRFSHYKFFKFIFRENQGERETWMGCLLTGPYQGLNLPPSGVWDDALTNFTSQEKFFQITTIMY